jgi:hypothetical protein
MFDNTPTLCGTGAACERACPFIRRGRNCPTASEAREIARSQGRTLGEVLRQIFDSASSTTATMSNPRTSHSSLK